jgi:lipoprotein-anchoring transpeptidase ErfK/SrfK
VVNAYLVCNTNIKGRDSRMNRVNRRGTWITTGALESLVFKDHFSGCATFSNSFWRIAVLTAAGAIGIASPAKAVLYGPSSDPGFSQPVPTIMPPRRHKVPRHSEGRHSAKKIEAPGKQVAKPQGPLVIAISINNQNLKIYDANGLFAETPVSTGMRGHPTPMGVFSVISKERLHHSNIYSGAPMPYMQRITWSGIAIHAGVLPGHPASHGCIRMPMAFAVKMYGWTKMGARVVITPGEMVPASFSHPLLVTQKVVPQPIPTDGPRADEPSAAKTDKTPGADAVTKPATSGASLELKSTVGDDGRIKSLMDVSPASTPLREQTRTADAGASPLTKSSPVTMSDAAPSGGNASSRETPATRTDGAPAITEDATSARSRDASTAEAKSDAAKSESATPEAKQPAAQRAEMTSPDDKPVEPKSSEAATPEIKSADADISEKAGKGADETQALARAGDDAVKTEAAASESAKADETKTETKLEDVKTEAAKTDAPKPGESAKTVVDASTRTQGEKKDQGRLPDAVKTVAAKPDAVVAAAPKRAGQIAVFVSRKDSKLYVRQNFAPLFDVPVTVAPSDRPLGTHVFTAQVDRDDANVLRWSVVTLPVPTRNAGRRDEDERTSRRRKMVGAAELKALAPVPDSPAEALDRLTIPAEAKARITEALSTGSSIIVSDQGIAAGETGEGTDFIVSLR